MYLVKNVSSRYNPYKIGITRTDKSFANSTKGVKQLFSIRACCVNQLKNEQVWLKNV